MHENAWKGNLPDNPSEGAINKPSSAERKESRAEMRHEFDGCYYVDMHKWCTHKATENEACKHGDMVKLQPFSYCFRLGVTGFELERFTDVSEVLCGLLRSGHNIET